MIPARVVMIDIETLPGDATVGMDLTQAPGWEAPEVEAVAVEERRPPSNWKDPAKIGAWMAKEMVRRKEARVLAEVKAGEMVEAFRARDLKAWRDTSMDPMKGRVALITLASGEHGTHVIDCAEDERAGLVELGEWIVDHRAGLEGRPITWVAHNGIRFDYPYLQIRALAHGSAKLARRFHQEKPWDGILVDTLHWWPQVGQRGGFRKGSLDDICAHLGIERPDNPITGANVLDAYVEGRWADVVAHGVADVRDLRQVYAVLAEVRGV